MIEEILWAYLSDMLDVPVYTERGQIDGAYVVIEKTGGSEENHLLKSTVAIQSYAESMYEAAVLNERVKEVMEDVGRLPSVSVANLNSDYNFTDTTTKVYRYQAVFDVVHFE